VVELKNDNQYDEILKLRQTIENKPYVMQKTVIFISKEQALQSMKTELGDEFEKMDIANPLVDVVSFNVKAENMTKEKLEEIRAEIKQNPNVLDVYYEESLVNDLSHNLAQIAYFALLIGILFIIIAYIIIHNTVRLSLFANRMLIKNMELVGASWPFIRRPYLVRAIKNGFLSAIVAIVALLVLLFFLQKEFLDFDFLNNSNLLFLLFIALTILSVSITTSSTFVVVNKYLKTHENDLI
jgi:cell division transport system permease protein